MSDEVKPVQEPSAADAAKEVVAPVEVKTDAAAAAPKVDPPKVDSKVVPEVYELTIPDGSPLHKARIDEIVATAKAQKLSTAEAQKLVDAENGSVTNHVEFQKSLIKQQSDKWVEEAKKDKDIGGEKFNENIKIAKDGVEYLSKNCPEAKTFLEISGLGNNPEMIKFFMNIGKMVQPDKIVSSNSSNTPERPPMEKRLYDNSTSPQT